ncbi:thermonuclease family protein [Variovorax sp. PCZ-1]|uniref:thermonuclease family protein n=1 Tax=Variovorax sp. PCZ-1 TaxID=2835533 RepID=UPI001BD12B90|nr:thermonuclease family protein [Variovorax sp. PCZ-1]MBS7806147.1 thermonuclease family protein [Variovorax sp. PCZ-1]
MLNKNRLNLYRNVACASALFWAVSSQAENLQGRVVAIADGDTVTVLDAQKVQHKIRLGGIDAPEKKQAFGDRSKETLSDCAFGRDVVVDWDKVDRYERKVGKILVAGVDCNLRQIKLGMAWHYKKYANEQSQADRAAYAAAEDVARGARTGLWSNAAPVAPWDFRAASKSGQ